MKNFLVVTVLFVFGMSQAQNQKIRAVSAKEVYKNVFYKSPKSGNTEMPFRIDRIVFSTSYKGTKNKNSYQISAYGMVNNKKQSVHYNASSIDEIAYYTKVLKEKYKKLLFFEYEYKQGSKTYTDTSIVVEY